MKALLNWLRRPATDRQITHGAWLWRYVVGVLLVFLVVPTPLGTLAAYGLLVSRVRRAACGCAYDAAAGADGGAR